jgi:enamine deaminase RidA (YjgF/YER057c/UK114 family)
MLKNISAALAALGASMADVVAITLHIPNRADVDRVSDIISANFEGIKPTATVLCTPLASEKLKIEMQVTALQRK